MKTDDPDSIFCAMPHCRGLTTLRYLGTPMCMACYTERCEKETEQERIAYDKIHGPPESPE